MPHVKTKLDNQFWDKVDIGDCWLWTGYAYNGYGQVVFNGRLHKAHRLVWSMLVGPVPDGHDLDHLCRVRACVNPDHLEPVTRSENLRRGIGPAQTRRRRWTKTGCPQGHPYSGDNVYVTP